MIDTIVLMLRDGDFSIAEHDKFSPSTIGLFRPPYYTLGGRGNFSCYQNPTTEEFKKGIYKPRLTVTKRYAKGGYSVTLRVEFSIPKLIFGNNFDEVEDSHFAHVVDRLCALLRQMGVIIFRQVLVDAPVSAVHYSKNIVLTDFLTPSGILNEIAKINLNQQLDLNQTDFRNDGHCLKFHSNSFELALYDKMKDLEKAKISGKRAVEKDQAIQLELFENFKPRKPFEVLRMEVRLNTRRIIGQRLEKVKIPSPITFSGLFKKEISKAILKNQLHSIKKAYSLIAWKPPGAKEFIAHFKIQNPKIRLRKALQVYGLMMACKELGIRGFREASRPYGNQWQRLKHDMELCPLPINFKVLEPIEKALSDFAPLKLTYFESKETFANPKKCYRMQTYDFPH